MGISGEAVMVGFVISTTQYTISDYVIGHGVGAIGSRIHAGRSTNRRQTGSPTAEERRCL